MFIAFVCPVGLVFYLFDGPFREYRLNRGPRTFNRYMVAFIIGMVGVIFGLAASVIFIPLAVCIGIPAAICAMIYSKIKIHRNADKNLKQI